MRPTNQGSEDGVPLTASSIVSDTLPAPSRGAGPTASTTASYVRPRVRGKFLWLGQEKLWLRGVTYGTFRPDADGDPWPDRGTVERDFAAMAANGFNAVRTYVAPPRWLLDTAQERGLHVLVGLAWEQHVTFLDDPTRAAAIVDRIRGSVWACAGHPAVLGYSVGNEIPAPIVRWHGRRRTERFIERLYHAAKAEDPAGLVTYVNYPTTEYLDLPFLDFMCFNVYLEDQARLEAYLARLQNLAGDRPLVMAEIGLDSRRHGEAVQATTLDWQVRTAFRSGCAGSFVFAWTDEWHRGGHDITDWDFGLTRRDRRPKQALVTVREALGEIPLPKYLNWPRISVIVCSYNGARTIRDTLDGLLRLKYPDFEVIVVNDGSTDDTEKIAREYGFRLISTENRGLSNARNTGLEAATGEIVAYIDDDAYPDEDWLTYLADTFSRTANVGVGGPNLPPPGDGWVADCVANAPGGPIHVLISDEEAEHIPGCNMAFRKDALQAIDGFDPQFRTAGDDVDVCWRLQQAGGTLGFSPAALVWHHRRNSVRAYWRQQRGYAKAEAMLEAKWPEKYNELGHLTWSGRLYGPGLVQALTFGRSRIYHGRGGSAPFQSLYQPAGNLMTALLLMPEFYLLLLSLAALGGLGSLWHPLRWALVPFAVGTAALVVQAVLSARRASYRRTGSYRPVGWKAFALTTLLHLMQPVARLHGRIRHGLTPWRSAGAFCWPQARNLEAWAEQWKDLGLRLDSLERALSARRCTLIRGADFDGWDFEVRGGFFGGVRLLLAVEEHGGGHQMVRARVWPRLSPVGIWPAPVFAGLAVYAALDASLTAASVLIAVGSALTARALYECGRPMERITRAFRRTAGGQD